MARPKTLQSSKQAKRLDVSPGGSKEALKCEFQMWTCFDRHRADPSTLSPFLVSQIGFAFFLASLFVFRFFLFCFSSFPGRDH